MNDFRDLVNRLIQDTIGSSGPDGVSFMDSSLGHFSPELVLCGTIVTLLLVRLFGLDRWLAPHWVTLLGAVGAFVLSGLQFDQFNSNNESDYPHYYFTGLMVFDQFAVFFKLFLSVALIMMVSLTVLSGIPDNEDGPDFYTLLLGATIGMMLMAGANHLLMLFLAVEMTSVPSYVMVGFMKGRRTSSEASLKYVVYGAGAAGVMLYGTSLVAGMLGTADFREIAAAMNELIKALPDPSGSSWMAHAEIRTIILGIMMVLVGLAFKLSLVPFHFWCPDAFEGAPAEVAGYLSVASKAGAFALLVRFCLAFSNSEQVFDLNEIYLYLGIGLGVIAAISVTYGNLAAYTQTNVKRLLAYSTIAHAGYMLMAVAALLVILNSGTSQLDTAFEASRCIEGLLYYLFVYLFMNLGAFAVVAMIRNKIFSEELDDYNGVGLQAPWLGVAMAICLFSLVGMPPFGGFFAKLEIFMALFKAGTIHKSMWVILAIGGINTVFSLFYYLRILKAMFLSPRPEGARDAHVPFWNNGAFVMLLAIPVLALGVVPPLMDALSDAANQIASTLIFGN